VGINLDENGYSVIHVWQRWSKLFCWSMWSYWIGEYFAIWDQDSDSDYSPKKDYFEGFFAEK